MIVEIDEKDLEALLHGLVKIREIEGIVRRGPPHDLPRGLPGLAEAHDRANAALLNARRREQYPERFEPVTEDEVRDLAKMFIRGNRILHEVHLVQDVAGLSLADHQRMRALRHLMVRGLIAFGVRDHVTTWGNGDVETHRDPSQWAKLLPKGWDALVEMLSQKNGGVDV